MVTGLMSRVAPSARTASLSAGLTSYAVMRTKRSPGWTAPSCRQSVMPSTSGMRTSETTTSYSRAAASARAPAALGAVSASNPTTSMPIASDSLVLR